MVTTSTLAETRQTFHRPLYRICERWQLPTNCGNASAQRWLWNWWKSIYLVYNCIAKFIRQMESRCRNGWLVRARLPMDKLEILMEIKDWMASTSFLCGENYWKWNHQKKPFCYMVWQNGFCDVICLNFLDGSFYKRQCSTDCRCKLIMFAQLNLDISFRKKW